MLVIFCDLYSMSHSVDKLESFIQLSPSAGEGLLEVHQHGPCSSFYPQRSGG